MHVYISAPCPQRNCRTTSGLGNGDPLIHVLGPPTPASIMPLPFQENQKLQPHHRNTRQPPPPSPPPARIRPDPRGPAPLSPAPVRQLNLTMSFVRAATKATLVGARVPVYRAAPIAIRAFSQSAPAKDQHAEETFEEFTARYESPNLAEGVL